MVAACWAALLTWKWPAIQAWVNSITPSHVMLASAGVDRKVLLWSMPDGTLQHTLAVDGMVRALAMSPDGSTLARRVSATDYAWYTLGEDLAACAATPEQVVAGWMSSPRTQHCADLSRRRFPVAMCLSREVPRRLVTACHVFCRRQG